MFIYQVVGHYCVRKIPCMVFFVGSTGLQKKCNMSVTDYDKDKI